MIIGVKLEREKSSLDCFSQILEKKKYLEKCRMRKKCKYAFLTELLSSIHPFICPRLCPFPPPVKKKRMEPKKYFEHEA